MLRIGPEPTDNEISTINIRQDNKRIGILKNPDGKYSLDVSGTINCGSLTVNGIRATFDGTNSGTWSISETDTISYVNGSVGIGTEEPAHDLDVSGSVNCSELLVNGTAPSFGGDYLKIYENYTETFDDYDEDVSNVIVDSASSSGTGGVWDLSNSNTISYTNGNVGIGTDMPESALQVAGNIEDPPTTSGVHLGYSLNNSKIFLVPNTSTANSEIEFYSLDSGDYGKIEYDHTNNRLQFQTNSADRMTIDSDGNVGIGTTSPSTVLHVQKDGINEVLQTWYSNLGNTAGERSINLISPTSDSDDAPFHFQTGNAITFRIDNIEALNINSGGNVGIGTTSPAYELDVSGDIHTNGYMLINGGGLNITADASEDDGVYIQMKHKNAEHYSRAFLVHRNNPDTLIINYVGDFTNVGIFGNVGIGTTSPAYTLDVVGNINCDELTTGTIIDPDGLKINSATGSSNFTNDIALNIGENYESAEPSNLILFSNSTNTSQTRNFILSRTHANVNVNGIQFGYSSNTAGTSLTTIYHFKNNGTATASTWSSTSDERMKFDVNDLSGCLSTIQQLEPKTYLKGDKPNEDRTNQNYLNQESGFLAQDVQKIDTLKHLVSSGSPEIEGVETEMLYLDYGSFIPYLVGAMKEQQIVIDSLKNELAELKSLLQEKSVI